MSVLNLSLDYRPLKFGDVVGQQSTVSTLRRIVAAKDYPRLVLLHGASGSGKTTLAQILAAAINCDSPKNGEPCGVCEFCKDVFENSNRQLFIKWDCATCNKVEDARSILEISRLAVPEGKRRVILMDECHAFAKLSFDLFLAGLEVESRAFGSSEKIPNSTILIGGTTEISKVPDTFISRALNLEFLPISMDDMVYRLTIIADDNGGADEEAILAAARLGSGNLRASIGYLGRILLHKDDWKTELKLDLAPINRVLSNLVELNPAKLHTRISKGVEQYGLKGFVERLVEASVPYWSANPGYWNSIVRCLYECQFASSSVLACSKLSLEIAAWFPIYKDNLNEVGTVSEDINEPERTGTEQTPEELPEERPEPGNEKVQEESSSSGPDEPSPNSRSFRRTRRR